MRAAQPSIEIESELKALIKVADAASPNKVDKLKSFLLIIFEYTSAVISNVVLELSESTKLLAT